MVSANCTCTTNTFPNIFLVNRLCNTLTGFKKQIVCKYIRLVCLHDFGKMYEYKSCVIIRIGQWMFKKHPTQTTQTKFHTF